MGRVIAVANQKGGVGKTATSTNLGIGLARLGKKVLIIDGDVQADMTKSLGFKEPDEIEETISNRMIDIIEDRDFELTKGILHHEEQVDLLPANIELAGIEVSLVNVMSRETILKQYVDKQRENYDYIIIDCMPSLGMLTINALVSANQVIIPVQTSYLPVVGLQQLIRTVGKVRRQLNPKLSIGGILLTMVDYRTNYAKSISIKLQDAYGGKIRIFESHIPQSVRMAETSAEGISIFAHDPKGKAAKAYMAMTEEVLSDEK
ncbi:MAG: ParA family protein [Lachnospiraceae bacterium]